MQLQLKEIHCIKNPILGQSHAACNYESACRKDSFTAEGVPSDSPKVMPGNFA